MDVVQQSSCKGSISIACFIESRYTLFMTMYSISLNDAAPLFILYSINILCCSGSTTPFDYLHVRYPLYHRILVPLDIRLHFGLVICSLSLQIVWDTISLPSYMLDSFYSCWSSISHSPSFKLNNTCSSTSLDVSYLMWYFFQLLRSYNFLAVLVLDTF